MPSTADLHRIRVEEQDLSTGNLELSPDRNESIEILARGIDSGGDEDVIVERVDETAVLNYPADEGDDELMKRDYIRDKHTDFLGFMMRMGFNLPTIKVPSGTTYELDNPNDAGTALVLYQDFNREEFSRDSPGGPEARRRPFISVAQTTETIGTNTTEEVEILDGVNQGGIEPWPWENDVPDDREYDLMAIAVDEDGSSGANIDVQTVRLEHNQQRFLENDQEFVDEELFDYPDDALDNLPWMFMSPATGDPDPLTFTPGDELNVEVEANNANTTGTEDAVVNAFVIARERRVG